MNFSSKKFIERLKLREHEALTLLIEEYHQALYLGAIKQKLATDQAEEVVQETWSTFFQKVENFEGRSHIRTYLFGIMYNKIKELWRSNKKYTQNDEAFLDNIFDDEGSYLSPPLDPGQWSQSNEFIEILSEELEKLPEAQRMAFYLKEIQGETTQDICNILGVSNTNLGVLIYRAKTQLRVKMEKRLNQ
ncbi:MAG: RNA polymerase sigma-70 factor (ECF subfamily) [Bacteriovoracaceae bacterium]